MPPIEEVSISSTITSKNDNEYGKQGFDWEKAITGKPNINLQDWKNQAADEEATVETPPWQRLVVEKQQRAIRKASTNSAQKTPPTSNVSPKKLNKDTPHPKQNQPPMSVDIPTAEPKRKPHDDISEAIRSGENKFHHKTVGESDPEDYLNPNWWKTINTITQRVVPPKVVRQTPLSGKITWRGNLSGFRDYKKSISGHFRQLGAGYLFNTSFWSLYQKYGDDVMEHWFNKFITK